ncbi:amino acid permease [Pelosinus propionicus]|uniref:Lysine:proton symporter, AAT family n=1 Tax=Pelosinus propionicus DSM 13327 TaxID=1123291 RepID=A0A1I4LLE9_9FIRM|nr:amino acid permease [Pelosinus propionicus]SFL91397.1 lysine:proton symporter, AAT family [Pelosinus propionicus DSM 13327]
MNADLETGKIQSLGEKTGVGGKEELKRSLKARHMNMIALGGAIGTGLFLASGASVSTAGPGGALVAYGVIGIMVYFLMTSLGEMATYLPVPGSFGTYAARFVDPALGFAIGWNYWLNWATCIAVELVAGAIIMKFWLPDIPGYYWSGLFLIILFALNYLSTRAYGESEYWFAGAKVITVIVFLVIGTLMILGIAGGASPGFTNWQIQEAPFVGGFSAILAIFMIAGFSFQGTELVGIAAGESENPERDVPKAINTVFWRILLFYIGALIVIGFILPYTDENLLKGDVENVAVSPFTLVFSRAGFTAAASLMNAIILTSVLSCANSGLYASTRMLYAMAKEGKAPRIFGKVNKRGVPTNSLYATSAIGFLAFLSSLVGEGTAYTWLLNITGMIGFIAWLGIAISHYRFRQAFNRQGLDTSQLKYKAKWFPFGPLFAMVLCGIVIIGQNYNAFLGGEVDWYGLAVSYVGIPIFLATYLGYKFSKKTKVVALEKVDLNKNLV